MHHSVTNIDMCSRSDERQRLYLLKGTRFISLAIATDGNEVINTELQKSKFLERAPYY